MHQSSTSFTTQFVEHWSDGTVLVESQVGYPGAQTEANPYTNPNSPYLMPRSNHQQMRNDANTKDKMKKLLNGEFGLWFKVDAD